MKLVTMLLRLTLCLCVVCCIESCKQKKQEETEATSFKTMKVERKDLTLTSSYSASIQGRQDIDIFPQVSGKIQRLCVKEGDKVNKGQLLFVIDQVPYRAALATALANEQQAKSNCNNAKITYESNQELYEQKVISAFTLETSKNSYYTAKAQVAQTAAQVIDARNNLSYTEVRSPSNGVVGVLPYRVGTLVSPTMPQPLTTVSDNSQMYVYFSMTEKQLLNMIRQYGTKDEAIKRMPAISLQLGDQALYSHKGKLESISGVIDQQTGTVSLRATFENPERLLNSGGSGNILIPTERKGSIIIPQTATVQQQDKHIVYKVINKKAVAQLITVEDLNDGSNYIVTNGLNVGDEIVADGAGMVHEGDIVNTK